MKKTQLISFAVILVISLGIQYLLFAHYSKPPFLAKTPVTMAPVAKVVAPPLKKPVDSVKFDPKQIKNIESIVQRYLLQNPEILVAVSNKLRQKQAENTQKKAMGAIRANVNNVFNDRFDPVLGNPNGKYVVVEFYDYRCGHCKAMAKEISTLMEKRNDIRFVMKELPIFGGLSKDIASISLAAYHLNPNKFHSLHSLLMASKSIKTTEDVYNIAKAAGFKKTALQKALKNPQIANALQQNFDLAQKIGISGTPALILANKDHSKVVFLAGRVPKERLIGMLKEL